MPRRGLALAMFVFAATALAASTPLRVTAPVDGTVLRGGSVATISWTPNGALPHGVVEWEAFLSVDGGRYYATRITPHLDIDIRSLEWRVPNVTSDDVRLLIRIGDEVEEKSVDVPLRLSIAADLEVLPPLVHVAASAGEPARPGDPGVNAWAAGDRSGREIVYERAPIIPSLQETTYQRVRHRHSVAAAAAVAAKRTSIAGTVTNAAAPFARESSPLFARDILLLVRRRNI